MNYKDVVFEEAGDQREEITGKKASEAVQGKNFDVAVEQTEEEQADQAERTDKVVEAYQEVLDKSLSSRWQADEVTEQKGVMSMEGHQQKAAVKGRAYRELLQNFAPN